MFENIPTLILFIIAAAALVFSLILNQRLKKLMKRERSAPGASDAETPSGGSPECVRLRVVIAVLDVAAVALAIIGFAVNK